MFIMLLCKQEKHNVQLSLMLDTLWSKVFSVCVLGVSLLVLSVVNFIGNGGDSSRNPTRPVIAPRFSSLHFNAILTSLCTTFGRG